MSGLLRKILPHPDTTTTQGNQDYVLRYKIMRREYNGRIERMIKKLPSRTKVKGAQPESSTR